MMDYFVVKVYEGFNDIKTFVCDSIERAELLQMELSDIGYQSSIHVISNQQ